MFTEYNARRFYYFAQLAKWQEDLVCVLKEHIIQITKEGRGITEKEQSMEGHREYWTLWRTDTSASIMTKL